jgi:chemotaxis protein CheX
MSKQTLDVDFLTDTMRSSALEVFGTMLGIEVEPHDAEPGVAVASEEHGVVSLLGLTGEWTGSGGLCCSADCARWIASQMLFSEYPEVNDEVRDAVGEITNMIIGNFKNNIGSETGPLAMSTPTVICGREMTTSNGGAHEWIVFPFRGQEHSFRMMVQLQPTKLVSTRLHEPLLQMAGSHASN